MEPVAKKTKKENVLQENTAADYLQVWVDYNEHILDMLGNAPEKDYLVINLCLLLETRDSDVFSFL